VTAPPYQVLRWVLAAVVLTVAYATTFSQLAFLWRTDPYAGHGMFVPLYSAFLVWADRHRLRKVTRRRDERGLMVMLLGLCILGLGRQVESGTLEGISVVVVAAGMVLLAFGGGFLRAVAFPVCFLVFMLPLPRAVVDVVSIHLQNLAAAFATSTIQFAGLPCYRAGIFIELPRATLAVAESCNGLRFLMALVTLTAAFAHASQRTPGRKLLLVGAAVPLAILANAVRVTVIALAAHYAGPAAAVGWIHHLIGKSVWALTLIPLLGLGLLLRRAGTREGVPGIERHPPAGSRPPITTGAASRPYSLEG
jgi:exosortase